MPFPYFLLAIEAPALMAGSALIVTAVGSAFAGFASLQAKRIEKDSQISKELGERAKLGAEHTQILFNTQQDHIKLVSDAYVDVLRRVTEVETQLHKCQDDKAEMRENNVRTRAEMQAIVEDLKGQIAVLRERVGYDPGGS